MARNQEFGAAGEALAVQHLRGLGFRVVACNWRPRSAGVRGELDVIAWDGPVLVFCEVKTRRGPAAVSPLEAITPRKQQQLRRLAAAFLAETRLSPAALRFDAVGVRWDGSSPQICHVRGVSS